MKEGFVARTTVTETNVAVGVADAAYVAANAKRVGLLLAGSPTAAITYSTLGAAVLGEGINIPQNNPGVWLDFGTHGTLVQKAWRSIAAGAIATGVNSIELNRAE